MPIENKKSAYFEKLRDSRWQKKRLEIMQRDKFTCRICGQEYYKSETECMQEAIDILVEIVKDHYFSSDISGIANALEFFSQSLPYPTEIITSILLECSYPEFAPKMVDYFWKKLSQRKKEKKKNGKC